MTFTSSSRISTVSYQILLRRSYPKLLIMAISDLLGKYEIDADVKFEERRGFWLRLRKADFDDKQLPSEFINVTTKGVWIECQTISMIQMSTHVADAHTEAVMKSDFAIQALTEKILEHVPSLFRLSEGIAMLDMIAAFCQAATTRDYVRPEMSDTLALKHARHPICERVRIDTWFNETARC